MTEKIVVLCKGVCGKDVSSAEVDRDGVCGLCQIMGAIGPRYEEYKRLYAKHQRYAKKGLPQAGTDKQIQKVVGHIVTACHAKLPVQGAIRLVNEICEKARAEVEGYDRILTVQQALTKEKPKGQPGGERRTASGIYLA